MEASQEYVNAFDLLDDEEVVYNEELVEIHLTIHRLWQLGFIKLDPYETLQGKKQN